MPEKISSIGEMTARAAACIREGKTLGLVPTMGALHEGHMSLIKRSAAENDMNVVSIFVNPAQFGPSEDLDRYPRDIEGDLIKLGEAGVDIAFIPGSGDIYPEGYSTYVNVEGMTEVMCGAFRPGHFRGVTTIVSKLLNIIRPTRAYFGQKDYQQAAVLKKMAIDLNMDAEMVICPIVREANGLAMSSRNMYLGERERKAAGVIYSSLRRVSELLESGELKVKDAGTELKREIASEDLVSDIQYASVFDPVTLNEVEDEVEGEVLLAVAIYIGDTRLIDNMTARVP